MRIVALSILMAVAGCTESADFGPRRGTWRLDTSANEGWYCVRAGVACAPPAYFTPPPTELTVGSGGVLRWSSGLEQTGTVESACIRVAAATEQGVARTEETFCNLVDGEVVNDTRAFAILGWAPGTADECTCSAHFDLAD